MFFVANTEERLGKNHPLRAIKRRAKEDVDPIRLRSVDSKTVAANTLRTRRQSDCKLPRQRRAGCGGSREE